MMFMMLFSFAVMLTLLLIIMSADMNGTAQITAVILAALMYIFIPATYSFGVEEGKEIVLNSISTPYTKTELYNMSDAEKDLLLKTYSGATIKYWKIDDKKENK